MSNPPADLLDRLKELRAGVEGRTIPLEHAKVASKICKTMLKTFDLERQYQQLRAGGGVSAVAFLDTATPLTTADMSALKEAKRVHREIGKLLRDAEP